ncbi:uncharacterized protein LOC110819147 isoform X1 [Carica papaya]|uniref:uncharacterized protein LOC110819147 isoform X1 n=1 Tax=Carica papaya TaxID=3649 RepID=UPI000B8CD2ED|nr:uncharacterized protein LOC110819147 isoform X1 [Carica papaya]
MEEQGASGLDSKIIAEKRGGDQLEEEHGLVLKRVKMGGLDSDYASNELRINNSERIRSKGSGGQFQFRGENIAQVREVPVTLDNEAFESARIEKSKEVNVVSRTMDLNTEICISNNSSFGECQKSAEDSKRQPFLGKHERERVNSGATNRGLGLDLNTDDVSSSVNHCSFDYDKNKNHQKLRDVSECGSSTVSTEEKDPLRVWKEMKQNGFLSSSHGGISMSSCFLSSSHGGIPVPKQRGKKCKNDQLKKKMELAKREQVDRFTKIAAPSGLLNELNPGIINHVRNRKQVHSIIEALVRSEKVEHCHLGSKNSSQIKLGSKDLENRKDLETMNDSGTYRSNFTNEGRLLSASSESNQTREHLVQLNKCLSSISEEKSGDCDSSMVDTASEDDALTLKLSSLAKASEIASSVSKEESTNFTSGASLTIKAATVAAQWLELLHQDIKGRLSALRRSKKRVRAVITTELPFLIVKEFSSTQENDSHAMKSSADGFPNNATIEKHRAKWSLLFDQMNKALCEEEKQLESWLNQVKDMQLHCDQGLQHINWNTSFSLKPFGIPESDCRSGRGDSSEKELAVKAAAASIYSTCSFLLSKENVSCF